MNALNNFLTSGHKFSENENLLKFRFSLLNIIMAVAALLNSVNFMVSIFGIIDFGRSFEGAIFIFGIVNIFVIYLLRMKKSHYHYVVVFFIIASLVLFYFVLITRKEDEFRLIAFFLAIFVTYVLLGKKQGMSLSLLIMVSILVLSKKYDLELSPFAYSTFFTFFVIFTIFLYFFISKIERDAVEFKLLNTKLKENVQKEVQQRKDQEVMLLRQCRMANMGQMLDSIAHQWRQPLMHINSILMNMDVALNNEKNNKKYLAEKTDEIADLTTYMSQTIEDFRGLFQLEENQKQFSLEDMVNDVLALMKNRFSGTSVDYEADGDTVIYGYRSELIQVFIILLSNAIDALDKKTIEDKKITIKTSASMHRTNIAIMDNAGGILSENLEAIFLPYFTTKELTGGTGLGLYIAQIIVEQKMGGEISVSNTTDGAKFSISLNGSAWASQIT